MQSNNPNIDDNLEHQEVFHGKYAVSIGTSLALETLFGINDLIPPTNPLPFTRYGYVIINVRTLIRNIYGAVAKELKTEFPAAKYLDKTLEELLSIPAILENQSGGRLEVLFYLPSYRSVAREFPHAILRQSGKKAYGRQHQEAIEQYCVAQLSAKAIAGELPIHCADIRLPEVDKPAVILTHQPIDLLSYLKDRNVDLIETHTGVIKDRNKWYTKLAGKGMECIPFAKWSLQFFGDGKIFAGYPPKQRAAILTFAEANKWNQTTTPDLIRMQLRRFPDSEIAEAVKKLL